MTEPTSSPLRQQPSRPPVGPAAAPGAEVGPVPGGFGPQPGPFPSGPPSTEYSTQPIPVVSTPDPAAKIAPVLLVRAALAVLAAIAALVAAFFLYRHGLSAHVFPAFVEGTDHTDVVRYRGPWIGGAALAVLIAGLLLIQTVLDLRRRAETPR